MLIYLNVNFIYNCLKLELSKISINIDNDYGFTNNTDGF